MLSLEYKIDDWTRPCCLLTDHHFCWFICSSNPQLGMLLPSPSDLAFHTVHRIFTYFYHVASCKHTKKTWKPNHWIIFQGKPWLFHDFLHCFIGNTQWTTNGNGLPLQGFPWFSMVFHGFPWFSIPEHFPEWVVHRFQHSLLQAADYSPHENGRATQLGFRCPVEGIWNWPIDSCEIIAA